MTDASTSSTSAPAAASSSSTLTFLRVAAILAAVGALASPLLALGPLTASGPLHALHGMVGNINLVLALAAGIAGFLWKRASGNVGLMGHALSLPVLALAQIALGEMQVAMVHIALGFAYLVVAVSLATLALRRPHGRG